MTESPYTSSKTPGSVIFGLLRNMILGWIGFNICVLGIGGYVLVRLFDIDTWPHQVNLAMSLTEGALLNPGALLPEDMHYQDIQLHDADGDGEQERVLFYRYEESKGRSPLGATILDLNACQPRGVDSYNLVPIDSDYLSEPHYLLETLDIPGIGGANDVLIWGVTPDGLRSELAIFQWYDLSDGCAAPAPGIRGYQNLGTFRGSGGIEIEGGRVRVKERVFDRSQLAAVAVYEPRDGSYRESMEGPMRPPVASDIEFIHADPAKLDKSHYPEKTVVAFYLDAGQDNGAAQALLEPAALAMYIDGGYGKDVAGPGQLTSMAEVKKLFYEPNIEQERRCEEVFVDVEVVNRLPDGTLTGPYRYRVSVQGVKEQDALPNGCRWVISRFEHLP